jgi:Mor family transcriptional regulator
MNVNQILSKAIISSLRCDNNEIVQVNSPSIDKSISKKCFLSHSEKRKIYKLYDEGQLTVNDIKVKYGLHEKSVYRILSEKHRNKIFFCVLN